LCGFLGRVTPELCPLSLFHDKSCSSSARLIPAFAHRLIVFLVFPVSFAARLTKSWGYFFIGILF